MSNRWVLRRDRKTAKEGAEVTRSGRLPLRQFPGYALALDLQQLTKKCWQVTSEQPELRNVWKLLNSFLWQWFRVTTQLENLEKSWNSKVVREQSGEVKSGVFFQAVNTPKLVFSRGFRTPLGELTTLPRSPSRLGRGTPHPLPPAVTTPTVK